MTNKIKESANRFVKKHNLRKITYQGLMDAAENIGYTVIEFNSSCNEGDVQTVISNLNLQNAITHSKGFTYIDEKYRLIFINESLNEDEKKLVLSHELGHISCGHFNTNSIIGKDVRDEFEANEFAHYLLKKDIGQKIRCWLEFHRKVVIPVIVIVALAASSLAAAMIINKNKSYYGEYYVTVSGGRYHKKGCVFIKNKTNVRRLSEEDFNSGKYLPCEVCLPGEKQ